MPIPLRTIKAPSASWASLEAFFLTPCQWIKGIGPKYGALLSQQGFDTVWDILTHFPKDYIYVCGPQDKTPITTSAQDEKKGISVHWKALFMSSAGTYPWRMTFQRCSADGTETLMQQTRFQALFFKKPTWPMAKGSQWMVKGLLVKDAYGYHMVHPQLKAFRAELTPSSTSCLTPSAGLHAVSESLQVPTSQAVHLPTQDDDPHGALSAWQGVYSLPKGISAQLWHACLCRIFALWPKDHEEFLPLNIPEADFPTQNACVSERGSPRTWDACVSERLGDGPDLNVAESCWKSQAIRESAFWKLSLKQAFGAAHFPQDLRGAKTFLEGVKARWPSIFHPRDTFSQAMDLAMDHAIWDKDISFKDIRCIYPWRWRLMAEGLRGRHMADFFSKKEVLAPKITLFSQHLDSFHNPPRARIQNQNKAPGEIQEKSKREAPEWGTYLTSCPQHAIFKHSFCPLDVARDPLGRPLSSCVRAVLQGFSHPLSASQYNAWGRILWALTRDKPMTHVLQGDVGTGKSIVAFLALAYVADCGLYACLMAPTETLIRQHFQNLSAWIPVCLVLAKGKTLGSTSASIALGTQALLYEAGQSIVDTTRLGLVIIDEQQRFGLQQRIDLLKRRDGKIPHMLSLSATPIPRTFQRMMSMDLTWSRLEARPGKKTITSFVSSVSRIPDLGDWMQACFDKGWGVYWVCSAIEDDEEGVYARAEYWTPRFAPIMACLHGRMSSKEKNAIMESFRTKEKLLLISTCVIEVGVHVDHGAGIIIENAPSFGLSQLHQLRGRVGRAHTPGFCFFLYKPPLSPGGLKRLECIRNSNDGFFLAKADWKHRGPGHVLSVRQSGFSKTCLQEHHAPIELIQEVYKASKRLCDALSVAPICPFPESVARARAMLRVLGYDALTGIWGG